MNEPHRFHKEVQGWIEKAEHDLLAAEHTLELAQRGLTDIICYHCQQCAEKYIKAYLVWMGVHFPKTHDLRLLLDLVPQENALELERENVIPLNRYSVEGRYPGEWEPITLQDALGAISMARCVRREVQNKLPPDVFRWGQP